MNFFQDILSGRNGRASSKRCMSVVAFLVIIQAVEMNLYSGAKLDTQLLMFLVAIVFGLSGAATIENMATKSPDSSKKVITSTSTDKIETTKES
jgi:hypothetical protein